MHLIVTPRLIIRDFLPDDADRLYAYLSDPEVTRYEPYEPFSRESADFEARARALNPSFRAVALKSDVPAEYAQPGAYECPKAAYGHLIGNLYIEPGRYNSYELGYVFNRDYWKQGYAFESASALMGEKFALGAHRFYAHCNPDNQNSWRLMERLGMRREGRMIKNAALKTDARGNLIYCDTFIYAILREEWLANRAARQ